ncbi:CaiB/BaiF CoA-transferase family protein [Chloroflexus sp. MS-CIW-1]|uniref:CaiB/BaiF CoA transferase family protein n=1 Tax=Chloroflexus sp. MS-CIW-1 TaxID=3055768 RepID=UPI0026491F48|nr:CaiB/BaiF CoA-transferase family protein [Chloroflexus sp. MS-CIW-1]MDN5272224.1 CaiB/BaiF CoA-transferase family protein [Chloroflexus sp. MS-CIW-1]
MTSALSDLLILDFSRVLAGPYATMVLADLGARVIKIEQPGLGDETRQWGPPFTEDGRSAYFIAVNRNKQSVTLNLKHPDGQAIARTLAQRADVLIENFLPGTMARLGLSYDDLRIVNPRLIYCSITGYGQYGPDAHRPGYDTVIQAEGGLMSITGDPDGPPMKTGVAIADITTGLYATTSILAALHYRTLSGEGQYIDLALFDVQLSWLANVASAYLISGQPPRRYGNAHATIVPYQPFAAADGYIMIAVGNDRQFARFCQVLDRPEWVTDERFATNPARVINRERLIAAIAEIIAREPVAVWVEKLHAADVPCGPVNDIPTALHSRQAQARAMVQQIDGIRMVGPAPVFSATPATIRSAPPVLGADTEAVLAEFGYSAEQIRRFRAEGIV